ncbi:MAG: hypothetical protein PHD97_05690 [Bacteroidales bacterium]|nr:hypothetical protein [Bacteroidales bacterium]
MNFSIVTEYPLWYIFICLLVGAVYAFILYRKDKHLEEFPQWQKNLLASFRFIVVALIAFLLLNPLIKTISRNIEKPIVIVAQDNSESIIIGKDSSFYKTGYMRNLNDFINKLSDKYQVKTFSFGDKVKDNILSDFSQKQTDLSLLFNEIQNKYVNRNLGAVIIASDGLYNKGTNPVYASGNLKVPVYTVALGDTNIQKDLIINKINYNRLVYLGNKFPVEVIVNAKQCKGEMSTLTISDGKQNLASKKINFINNNEIQTHNFELEAKEPGNHRYRITLSNLKDEITYANNIQDIFIDVINGREKILILFSSPHPDIAALKESIESNNNYEVEISQADKFINPINPFSLIIVHQLPSSDNSGTAILSNILKSNIPVLFIIGSRTNINLFNALKTGLNISGIKNKMNEAQGNLNNNFSSFTISDNLKNFIEKLPPLYPFFGTYKMSPDANVFLYQKIGSVDTDYPLILLYQSPNTRTGIITGEGIWKWRLQDFAIHENHDLFNEITNKIVQYLSVKVDKRYFRIISKNIFLENEPVTFDAEVYNESYELINTPEINIDIFNPENKKFSFVFNKTSKAYMLDAGMFPVGTYRYEAKAKAGDKLFSDKGQFTVTPITIEASNTVADHQLMNKLAKTHNGKMYFPNQFENLLNEINGRDDIKTVSYTNKKLKDIINMKWIFFLLIFLLSVEWFVRKRGGAY